MLWISLHIPIEFIVNVLQNKGHVPGTQISKSSDEYVLDQLSTSEEKLLKLLEELDGQDLSELLHNMEEEEVSVVMKHSSLEGPA